MGQQPKWGTVNLGVDVLQGHGEQSQPGKDDWISLHPKSAYKQSYNPGRNQELNLPADVFPMHKNQTAEFHRGEQHSPSASSMHERIKELIGEGWPRKFAVAKAKEEANGNDGALSQRDIYRHKYQAPSPKKQPSVFTENVQNYPFI